MPWINPADAQYLLQQHVMRDMDNVNVMQKCFEIMVKNAQEGFPLNRVYDEIQGGRLGQELVWTRQYIQGMQAYLVRAQAAIAEGGTAALNFLQSARAATAAIGQEAMAYVETHPGESATLAGATGRAGIQYTLRAGASAATAGEAPAAGATAGEATLAAGTVAEGSTVAAGVVAETTVATGAVAETAALTTTAAAGTAVAAEAGAGATLATGAASGSWLGPVGIAVGLTIAAAILTATYLATHKDKPTPTVTAAATTSSSSSQSSFSSRSSSSSSSSTSSSSSGSGSDSSSDTDSSDSDSSSKSSSESSSDTDSSTLGGGGGSRSSSSSSGGATGIDGTYVITEDKTKFSSGSSQPDDPLGCAGRRVPATMKVTRQGTTGIVFTFNEDPNSSAFDHPGDFDGTTFVINYPDGAEELEGRFEQFGSELDIQDGRYFSGDCTFFFSGKRQ